MSEIFYKFGEFYSEKRLTIISLFFNLTAGNVLRFKTPVSSLFWRQLIQLENKGQNFE